MAERFSSTWRWGSRTDGVLGREGVQEAGVFYLIVQNVENLLGWFLSLIFTEIDLLLNSKYVVYQKM